MDADEDASLNLDLLIGLPTRVNIRDICPQVISIKISCACPYKQWKIQTLLHQTEWKLSATQFVFGEYAQND